MITVTLVYLGLHFYKVDVESENESRKYEFFRIESRPPWMRENDYQDLVKAIREDYKVLEQEFSSTSKKTDAATKWNWKGSFSKIHQTDVFVYSHESYRICSGVMYSNFFKSNIFCLQMDNSEEFIPSCQAKHGHHLLSSFFRGNMELISHLEGELKDMNALCQVMQESEIKNSMVAEMTEVSEFLAGLRQFVEKPDDRKIYCFKGDAKANGLKYDENVWSTRLVGGLESMFKRSPDVFKQDDSELSVEFTAQSIDFNSSVEKWSGGVQFPSLSVFRGAPDFTIKKSPVITSTASTEEIHGDEMEVMQTSSDLMV